MKIGVMTIVRSLGPVAAFGLGLSFFSGKARGPLPDSLAANMADWLQRLAQTSLAGRWCHPMLASAAVSFLSFAVFSGFLLASGDALRRLPRLCEFLTESDLGRRRGRKLASLAFAVGLSLPLAVTLAITSSSVVSVYSVVYSVLVYGFIRTSVDEDSSNRTLDVYSRFRNALAPTDIERDRDFAGGGEEVEL